MTGAQRHPTDKFTKLHLIKVGEDANGGHESKMAAE